MPQKTHLSVFNRETLNDVTNITLPFLTAPKGVLVHNNTVVTFKPELETRTITPYTCNIISGVGVFGDPVTYTSFPVEFEADGRYISNLGLHGDVAYFSIEEAYGSDIYLTVFGVHATTGEVTMIVTDSVTNALSYAYINAAIDPSQNRAWITKFASTYLDQEGDFQTLTLRSYNLSTGALIHNISVDINSLVGQSIALYPRPIILQGGEVAIQIADPTYGMWLVVDPSTGEYGTHVLGPTQPYSSGLGIYDPNKNMHMLIQSDQHSGATTDRVYAISKNYIKTAFLDATPPEETVYPFRVGIVPYADPVSQQPVFLFVYTTETGVVVVGRRIGLVEGQIS